MSFQFCFSEQLDKPTMQLNYQIILPFFKDFFSSTISTLFNSLINTFYQGKLYV